MHDKAGPITGANIKRKARAEMECIFINPNTREKTEEKIKEICLKAIDKYNISI